MSTAPPTPIAIALVEHGGCFLVGRRHRDAVLGGMWEFPGGKVGPEEPLERAVRRECLEETGLEINVGGLRSTVIHRYPHGTVELHFFDCTPVESAQRPHAPFRWIARCELSGLEFPEANATVIEQLCRHEARSSGTANSSLRSTDNSF